MKTHIDFKDKYYIIPWIVNLFLLIFYIPGATALYTSILNYNLKSDIFSGTVIPISSVPNYIMMTKEERKMKYDELDSKYFIDIPEYNSTILARNVSSKNPGDKEYEETNSERLIYITPYMGSYNHNGLEYDGSHLAVDIKAPIGTPIKNIANGVVVRVENNPNGFGKFVVIRHDNVNVNGVIKTIYSGYAHMNEIYITTGKKIAKGTLIGTVGETGMAVGSHLHFQIDNAEAPFHPYWPFTTKEILDAGVNFFEGINVGLGKKNAIKYTIHPMDFVQNNINYKTELVKKEEPKLALVNSLENIKKEEPKTEIKEEKVEEIKEEIKKEELQKEKVKKIKLISSDKENLAINIDDGFPGSSDIVISDHKEVALLGDIKYIEVQKDIEKTTTTETTEKNIEVVKPIKIEEKKSPFKDLLKSDKYYKAVNYLYERGIVNGFDDTTFKVDNSISRSEVIKIVFNAFEIGTSESNINYFGDVKNNYWQKPYVNKGVEMGIISKNKNFYPNRVISIAEVAKILIKSKKINIENYKNSNMEIRGVSKTHWFYPYGVYLIQNNFIDIDGKTLDPNKQMTRGEAVELIYKIIL